MKQSICSPMRKWNWIFLFTMSLTFHGLCFAGDWQICGDRLDDLKIVSVTATEAKARAASANEKLDTIKSQLQSCINNPDQFDSDRDQCNSLLKKWGTAKSAYDSALADLNKVLNEIARYSQEIQQSCQPATGRAEKDRKGPQIKAEKEGEKALPAQLQDSREEGFITEEKASSYNSTELEFCMRSMNEAECRRRLNIK